MHYILQIFLENPTLFHMIQNLFMHELPTNTVYLQILINLNPAVYGL